MERISPRFFLSISYYLFSLGIFLKNLRKKDFSLKLNVMPSKTTAYLIATGPSLKRVDLSKLVNQDIFTVSNSILHEKISLLNPYAHFIAAFHAPLNENSITKWLNLIDQKLPHSTDIVTDYKNKAFVDDKHFLNRKVIYLETFPMLDFLLIAPPYITPRPWSVPQLAIPYIFSLGYKKVVLCGCDHTALANYGNTIEHFYDPKLDIRLGASDKLAWEDGGIIKQLNSNLELFQLYATMKNYYEKRGKSIVRLTSDGWLDFIPIK
jgi:hypothetical protein